MNGSHQYNIDLQEVIVEDSVINKNANSYGTYSCWITYDDAYTWRFALKTRQDKRKNNRIRSRCIKRHTVKTKKLLKELYKTGKGKFFTVRKHNASEKCNSNSSSGWNDYTYSSK